MTEPLRSALLDRVGVAHAFTTRPGGVSVGVFASLNLGNPGELPAERRDPLSNIRENFARVLRGMGEAEAALTQVHQVHGGVVDVVRGPREPGPDPKADAIVTDRSGLALCVRVADCAPVLIASDDGRVVAAVHAGWRGVIAGVATAAARAAMTLGARRLVAAVGPCISADRFEVGAEVLDEFTRRFGADERIARPDPARPGKGFVDLKEALRRQLAGAGVEAVDVLPHCAFADERLFFSHRRERGLTGRNAALICARG
jgi:hypothetical protein